MIDIDIEKYSSIREFSEYYGFPVEALPYMDFSNYLEYFDNEGLFIGITCDADGIFWIPEVCSIPMQICKSRKEAQELAIEECFRLIDEMKGFGVK